jgi:hypothetical protein
MLTYCGKDQTYEMKIQINSLRRRDRVSRLESSPKLNETMGMEEHHIKKTE